MARCDMFEPGVREPKSGVARKLWDKAVRETGRPPTWLIANRPGRCEREAGACSHSMEVQVDGEKREYLAWWPSAEALSVPLREARYDYILRTYWIG